MNHRKSRRKGCYKERGIQRKIAEWLSAIIGTYLFFVILNLLQPGNSECITRNWCITAEEQLFQFALYQTLVLLLILLSVALALMLCGWLFMKSRLFLVTGILMIGIATWSVLSVLLSAPPEALGEYIHIFVIGVGTFVLGSFILSIDIKRK